MSLTGKTKANSYKDILQMNNSNSGVDTTIRNVGDGEGTASAISLSDDNVIIKPVNDDNNTIFQVSSNGDERLLRVDSSNDVVRAGIGQNIVNTQYAYFGANNIDTADFTDDIHMAIPFNSQGYGDLGEIPAFGTGGDPALLFTTANASATRASDLVPLMWRVPDNITIDEIKHFEGADIGSGDTTRMHLVSYTFNSGATGALTSGAVVANTLADNTNAGSEQPYLKDWTIGTEDIDAGTVLLCFFRSDSINSDYSISVTIKYHLR